MQQNILFLSIHNSEKSILNIDILFYPEFSNDIWLQNLSSLYLHT